MALTCLENVISAKEVAKRWDVDSWTLGEITRKDRICTYRVKNVRKSPSGKKIYLCDGPYGQGMPYTEEFRTRKYDLDMYAFKVEDIQWYEFLHPEYLLPRIAEDEDKEIPIGEIRKEPSSSIEAVDTSDLEGQLAEAQKQIESFRQWNKLLNEQNKGLRAELATCRKQLEETRDVTTSGIEGHGLCSQVIHMRQDGKTEEEIAATLYDNKQWCSIAQVGALLHRGGRVTADSMLKYGQRLLGKA